MVRQAHHDVFTMTLPSLSPAKPVHKNLILLTVIIGTFLGRLDQTIVNLALPKIITDYGITVSSAGWIATAYILANAIFVPIWGKLGDTIGRKKVYIMGFSMFIVGSMLAGIAWNLPSMIVFRVIQAIAGSADYPTAMAILAVTYTTDKERGQALGLWSSSFAAASVFGPLIGGPLIDHFSWRSVFLINIPVGIIGILMAMAYISESKSAKATKSFDVPGAIALGIFLSAIVLVLDKGMDWGWLTSGSVLCYVIAAIAFGIFIFLEQRHPEPLVDLRIFNGRVFTMTILNNFIVFMGIMGSVFLVPVFAQTFLGFDATQSGLLFVPMAAAIMIAAPIGGKFTGKVQPCYIIFISTLIGAIGIAFFILIDARSTAMDMMMPLALMAFGLGFGMGPRTNIIAAAVPKSELGMASSVLALARNIAGAFGVAVSATILNSSIEHNVLLINQYSSFHGTAAQYPQYVALIMFKAQINGYKTVFFVSAIIIFIGAILALFIGNVNMKKNETVHVEA